jgi:hypothetical protein
MSTGATEAERLGAIASLATAGMTLNVGAGYLSSPIAAGGIAAIVSMHLQASAEMTALIRDFNVPASTGPYVSAMTLSSRYTSTLADYERIDGALRDFEQLKSSSNNNYIGTQVSRSSRGISVETERTAAAPDSFNEELDRRRRDASNRATGQGSGRSSWLEFNEAVLNQQAGQIQRAQQQQSQRQQQRGRSSKECRQECVQRGEQIRCELQPAPRPCYSCARYAEVCD